MRRFAVLATCAGVVLLLAACDEIGDAFEGVRGSGNVITEDRAISGFDEIVVMGSGDIVVTVTGTESLTIEAEDNILPLLTTKVSNGRLELGSKESFSTTKGIKYTITAVTLAGIEVNGSGDVEAIGIDAESFEVEVNGSGKVDATGVTSTLDIGISGSGTYMGEALIAPIGKVRVSGSGTAIVNVTDDLEARMSGSGRIRYIGDPVLDADTSGSGSIARR